MNTINIQTKGVVIVTVVVAVLILLKFKFGSSTASVSSMMAAEGGSGSWKKGGFMEIPPLAKEKSKTVAVTENEVEITVGGKTLKSFYRTAEVQSPKSVNVLLLHGQMFTSQTWQDDPMHTIQLLSALNYRTVAIDLPGYGKNKENTLNGILPEDFLQEFIAKLQLSAPVIVSPSMSGSFSLPYLFKGPAGSVLQRSRGFVPVAPVGTERYKFDQYHALQIPTLIFCGTLDKSIGPTSVSNLKQLPNHELVYLQGAKHPAYLDQPDEFHADLYTFLLALEQNSSL